MNVLLRVRTQKINSLLHNARQRPVHVILTNAGKRIQLRLDVGRAIEKELHDGSRRIVACHQLLDALLRMLITARERHALKGKPQRAVVTQKELGLFVISLHGAELTGTHVLIHNAVRRLATKTKYFHFFYSTKRG